MPRKKKIVWAAPAVSKARVKYNHAVAMYGEDSDEAKNAKRKLDRLLEQSRQLDETPEY